MVPGNPISACANVWLIGSSRRRKSLRADDSKPSLITNHSLIVSEWDAKYSYGLLTHAFGRND